MKTRAILVFGICLTLLYGAAGLSHAQGPVPQVALGSAFTYQGQLRQGANLVNGTCDLQFSLWDAASGGAQVGATLTKPAEVVSKGVFGVQLDLGAGVFGGEARYLQVAVRCPAGSGGYTALSPRQALTAAPYALYAVDAPCWSLSGNAGLAASRNQLGTLDSMGVTLVVSGAVALRLEHGDPVPNLIGGWRQNSVEGGVMGATIGGGGAPEGLYDVVYRWDSHPNAVQGDFGTVSGGLSNAAGGRASTVSGGEHNVASGDWATVGGGGGPNQGGPGAWQGENAALGMGSTVSGGQASTASGDRSTVAGGLDNVASGSYSVVGGGGDNRATAGHTTVAGGWDNTASHAYSTVGGGANNRAEADYATIAGGGATVLDPHPTTGNRVTDDYGTVGGGGNNRAGDGAGTRDDHPYATVAGGQSNTASGWGASVGGGTLNDAAGATATVAGGDMNSASGYAATVSGGEHNAASQDFAIVGGGSNNTAQGPGSTVAGGVDNRAMARNATIGGGGSLPDAGVATGNRVTDDYGTVGGGGDNQAGDNAGTTHDRTYATVSGGRSNVASGSYSVVGGGSGNRASGYYAVVPGGSDNVAAGLNSLAAGSAAHADHSCSFVWADCSTYVEYASAANNEFRARAAGGVTFHTNPFATTGVRLAPGGTSWLQVSDAALKENYAPADGRAILERVASMRVQTWNLKSQDPGIRHIGPVAQEFAALGYGEDAHAINAEDADGVALAAIQGLYAVVQEQGARLTALEERNAALEARLAALERTSGAAGGRQLPAGGAMLAGAAVAGVALVQRRRTGGGR